MPFLKGKVMTILHNLGFARMGVKRELKRALEAYWSGKTTRADLTATGKILRARHWQLQKELGVDLVPVGDFAYYDHMLNMAALLGAIPPRFATDAFDLDHYFLMARGAKGKPALEMTKWFDTNYHYLVPEFHQDTTFKLTFEGLFHEIAEAKALGVAVKPVLVGPLTFLYLGKEKEEGFSRLDLLPKLLPVYQSIFERLSAEGIEWMQIDEPILTLELDEVWQQAFSKAYGQFSGKRPKILLTSYFDSIAHHAWVADLPVDGLHLDAVYAASDYDALAPKLKANKQVLSLGVVNGRNIWKSNLDKIQPLLTKAAADFGDKLWLAPSCSLLHTPVDLAEEKKLAPELHGALAFGVQKLQELNLLRNFLQDGPKKDDAAIYDHQQGLERFFNWNQRTIAIVQEKVANLPSDQRANPYTQRSLKQKETLNLPVLPTTTIGSFPQTPEIRKSRAEFSAGKISEETYTAFMQEEIAKVIRAQEELDIDVLVHGEPERNDMVEYFADMLEGFAFTENGWVQSYGSRCVKPPIIFGDITRKKPMTIDWIAYAQSLSKRPVKGMLTGPVTMLQWAFVRDDQPREKTAYAMALALRDEVEDLVQAGIRVIQIDEPAFREGLPLKRSRWDGYTQWAARAFRLSAAVAPDSVQIHTHMCYSEFNDIMPAIESLDADVISIETSRSDMELLQAFMDHTYPREIGPGVYDIHSPIIPTQEEMQARLEKAMALIPKERLWVNPDCGLKTRRWEEVTPALASMVAAAKALR